MLWVASVTLTGHEVDTVSRHAVSLIERGLVDNMINVKA